MACKSGAGSSAIVRILLDDDQDQDLHAGNGKPLLASIADSRGHLPLHSSIHTHANVDVVQTLLHAHPAIMEVTNEGDTALHLACMRRGVPEEVGILLANETALAQRRLEYRDAAAKSNNGKSDSKINNSGGGGGGDDDCTTQLPLTRRNNIGETCLDIFMSRFGVPPAGTEFYKGDAEDFDADALGICMTILRLAASSPPLL